MTDNSDAHGAASADSARRGLEHADVIDMIGVDATTGAVVLAMEETRPWDGSNARLFQLQEKCNAYLSFALDGEMRDAYPDLAGRAVCVRVNTVFPLDPAAAQLLATIGEQIGFQGVTLEVMVSGTRVDLPEIPRVFGV